MVCSRVILRTRYESFCAIVPGLGTRGKVLPLVAYVSEPDTTTDLQNARAISLAWDSAECRRRDVGRGRRPCSQVEHVEGINLEGQSEFLRDIEIAAEIDVDSVVGRVRDAECVCARGDAVGVSRRSAKGMSAEEGGSI